MRTDFKKTFYIWHRNFFKWHLPRIKDENYSKCITKIKEDSLHVAFKSISANKTPGSDDISKEFYEAFWDL